MHMAWILGFSQLLGSSSEGHGFHMTCSDLRALFVSCEKCLLWGLEEVGADWVLVGPAN